MCAQILLPVLFRGVLIATPRLYLHFSSPSLPPPPHPIHLFSSVDHGELISICFAAISWQQPCSHRGASLLGRVPPLTRPSSPAFAVLPGQPARGPGTRRSPRFSEGFFSTPVGDVECFPFLLCSQSSSRVFSLSRSV